VIVGAPFVPVPDGDDLEPRAAIDPGSRRQRAEGDELEPLHRLRARLGQQLGAFVDFARASASR
jgi:hypothetical protein